MRRVSGESRAKTFVQPKNLAGKRGQNKSLRRQLNADPKKVPSIRRTVIALEVFGAFSPELVRGVPVPATGFAESLGAFEEALTCTGHQAKGAVQ